MCRTDRRGRDLKQFLQAEIVGRDVTAQELREAVGVSTARYYGRGDTCGRSDASDFPNTEELRHVSEYYALGREGYQNLLVEFDWLDQQEESPGYTGASPFVLTGVRPTVVVKSKSRRQTRRVAQRENALRNPSL